jgi:hypothetical protein
LFIFLDLFSQSSKLIIFLYPFPSTGDLYVLTRIGISGDLNDFESSRLLYYLITCWSGNGGTSSQIIPDHIARERGDVRMFADSVRKYTHDLFQTFLHFLPPIFSIGCAFCTDFGHCVAKQDETRENLFFPALMTLHDITIRDHDCVLQGKPARPQGTKLVCYLAGDFALVQYGFCILNHMAERMGR